MAEFWQEKALNTLSNEEWESLCDGCARCCLQKLEDEADGSLHYTNIACRYLDLGSCRCSAYANRTRLVPDCIQVTAENAAALEWMPSTCAYRLLGNGQPLPPWHPLLTGDPDSIHEAGISVRSFAVSELQLNDPEDPEELQAHIVEELG